MSDEMDMMLGGMHADWLESSELYDAIFAVEDKPEL